MIWFILVIVVAAVVYFKLAKKKPAAVVPPVVVSPALPTPAPVPAVPVKPPVTPVPTPTPPVPTPTPPAPVEPVPAPVPTPEPLPPPAPAKPVVNYAVFAGETREGLEYKFKHGYARMPEGFDWAVFEASGFMAQPQVVNPSNPGDTGSAERNDPVFGWRGSMIRYVTGVAGTRIQRPLPVPAGWRGDIHVQGAGEAPQTGFARVESFDVEATDSKGKRLGWGSGNTLTSFHVYVTNETGDPGTITLTYTVNRVGTGANPAEVGGGYMQVNLHPAR